MYHCYCYKSQGCQFFIQLIEKKKKYITIPFTTVTMLNAKLLKSRFYFSIFHWNLRLKISTVGFIVYFRNLLKNVS